MTNKSFVPKAGFAQAASPKDRRFAHPAFHLETRMNAKYCVSNDADLGEILETVMAIDEGDAQSWYTAWKATADLVLAVAERTQESFSKGGA